MNMFTKSKSYDGDQLAQLKEAYYTALGEEISAGKNPDRLPTASFTAERQAAEDDLIDFADTLLTDDPEAQALLRQRRLDMKKQLVALILRLSAK